MTPYDEEDIKGEDRIIRRIDPDQHVVWDDNRKCHRISSKAFQASSVKNGGMSVDIEKLISDSGKDPYQFVTTPKFRGSVWWSASSVRGQGLSIGYAPIEPDNPFHGEVWRIGGNSNRFTKNQKSHLQNSAQWFVEIDNVHIR